MTVQLWYQSSDVMPGGFYATYNTADEALAQAIGDVHVGRVPGPDRIVNEDGSVVDRKTILEAAAPVVDVPPAVEQVISPGRAALIGMVAAAAVGGTSIVVSGGGRDVGPSSSGTLPANTAEPAVTGTVATGSVLSTSNGSWTGSPSPSFSYQWQDCAGDGTACSNIGGATSSTYTVASGDAGHAIEANVTASNSAGSVSAGAPMVPLIDEFSGSSVDANVWRVMNQQGDTSGNEEECYLSNHSTVAGGDLTEQLDFNAGGFTCPAGTPSDAGCTGNCATVNGGGTAHWESGAVQQKAISFLYGTIKVSAEMAPQTQHSFPAIWMLGDSCETSSTSPFSWLSGVSGTPTGFYCPWSADSSNAAEIDIIEANAGNDTSYTMTQWNGGVIQHCTSGAISNYSSNFHTYELDWSVGSLTWKVDGTTECTSTTSVPSHPMFLIINTAESGAASSGGGNTVVDFAHVSH